MFILTWIIQIDCIKCLFIRFAGAQFGTIISMPLSGLLSAYGFDGGWPSIFYVFGLVGVVWSVAFLIFVYEDPSTHPNIDEKERKYINSALWGATNVTVSSFVSLLIFLFTQCYDALKLFAICRTMETRTPYRLYRGIDFHVAHCTYSI